MLRGKPVIESELLLGKLLVKKGYVTTDQLMRALDFQENLDRKNWMPVGEILIRYKYLTRERLEDALSDQKKLRDKVEISPKDSGIVRNIAQQMKNLESPFSKGAPVSNLKTNVSTSHNSFNPQKEIIPAQPQALTSTVNQPHQFRITNLGRPDMKEIRGAIEDAKKLNETPRVYFDKKPDSLLPPPPPPMNSGVEKERAKQKPIGEILVEKGYITRHNLSHALQYQSKLPPSLYKPIGQILVELGFVTKEQVEEALSLQPPKNGHSIGEILTKLGFINEAQLSAILSQQHSVGGKPVLIGELLVEHGFINKEQLEQALKIQKDVDNKLI